MAKIPTELQWSLRGTKTTIYSDSAAESKRLRSNGRLAGPFLQIFSIKHKPAQLKLIATHKTIVSWDHSTRNKTPNGLPVILHFPHIPFSQKGDG
mmetsp:Transcript_71915/g.126728  ORF Transcript_71915/g.126728 Transcript_71915/m.126728 type:complete len:95 (-) Transcript_71915:1272-1556(-)